MSSNNKRRSDKEIVETLFDLMFDAEIALDPDLDKRLKEQHHNPDALVEEGLAFVKNLKREFHFRAATRKKERFAEFCSLVVAEVTGVARRAKIENLLMPKNKEQQLVFNRRLTEISDDDLESQEEDTMLLELWNDFSSMSEEE